MRKFSIALFLWTLTSFHAPAFSAEKASSPVVAAVSFKYCLENSKIGKQEQARFEQMRKQMEQSIEKKEKELKDMSPKFSEEYLDSLTPEAEVELKDKFKNLSTELTQQQNQYYQTLNQTNMEIVQKMYERICEACTTIAKEKGFDLVLNDESCFYKADSLDISSQVVTKLDGMLDQSDKK